MGGRHKLRPGHRIRKRVKDQRGCVSACTENRNNRAWRDIRVTVRRENDDKRSRRKHHTASTRADGVSHQDADRRIPDAASPGRCRTSQSGYGIELSKTTEVGSETSTPGERRFQAAQPLEIDKESNDNETMRGKVKKAPQVRCVAPRSQQEELAVNRQRFMKRKREARSG